MSTPSQNDFVPLPSAPIKVGKVRTERDSLVLAAMIRYGGSFANAIAVAAMCADSGNLLRLKVAFKDLWEQYDEMAKMSSKLEVKDL